MRLQMEEGKVGGLSPVFATRERGGDQVEGLASRWLALEAFLKEAKQEFLEKTRGAEEELSEIKKQVQAIAQESPERLAKAFTIKPSFSRKIDPIAFAKFLKQIDKRELFWDYVTVGITAATRDFGEQPLVEAGALDIEVNPIGNIKPKRL